LSSEIQSLFLAAAFFQIVFESGFQQASFQVWLFCSTSFLSAAKFQVVFVESLKLASKFLASVLVCDGFDWLCFATSALFVVGFVGFQNWLIFSWQKFWQNISRSFSASILVSIKFSRLGSRFSLAF